MKTKITSLAIAACIGMGVQQVKADEAAYPFIAPSTKCPILTLPEDVPGVLFSKN